MTVTSLQEVSAYLLAKSVSVSEPLRAYGFSGHEIKIYQYYGFSEIRVDPHRSTADQLVVAGLGLTELPGGRDRVRYLLQARTMPVAAPYPLNPLHEARDALGLKNAQAFAVDQQACASVLMAVGITGRILAEDGDPDALALVFAGEKPFTKDGRVLGTTAVVGEGLIAAVSPTGSAGLVRLLGLGVFLRRAMGAGAFLRESGHLFVSLCGKCDVS